MFFFSGGVEKLLILRDRVRYQGMFVNLLKALGGIAHAVF